MVRISLLYEKHHEILVNDNSQQYDKIMKRCAYHLVAVSAKKVLLHEFFIFELLA